MNTYENNLKEACVGWLHTHYYTISDFANIQPAAHVIYASDWEYNSTSAVTQDWPEIQLPLPIGPWKSLFIKLKQPEENLSDTQRKIIEQLREQGNRVQVIRCLEDFKTFIDTYVPFRRL